MFRNVLMSFLLVVALMLASCNLDDEEKFNFTSEETVNVQEFRVIDLEGYIDLFFTQSGERTLTIKTEKPEQMEEVKISFGNNSLTIKNQIGTKGKIVRNSVKIQAFVTAPNIEAIDHSGAGRIEFLNATDLLKLSLDIAGAVSVVINDINVGQLDIDYAGAGNAVLSGNVDFLKIDLAGASRIEADKLISTKTIIDMSGAGFVSTHTTDELDADVSGIGRVEYYGNPRVKIDTSGLATVQHKD
jgi:hypothetical protein